MGYSAEVINNMFLAKLDDPAFEKEAAAMVSSFIRDKLRETGFAKKILGSKNVTPAQCQVSTQHEGLVYIDEIEPESGAVAITWTGDPIGTYIQAKKYEIPFLQIASEAYEIKEQELMASKMPVTKRIEKNTVKDIATIEDWRFLILCEAAVARTGKVIKGTATDAGVSSGSIEREDIVNLMNQIATDERPASTILINDVDFNKLLKWDAIDIGDDLQGKRVVNGISDGKLMGLKVIRTLKVSLLEEGNIWIFTPPEFLGRFLILGNTHSYTKKRRDVLQFESWEFVGMSIANTWSLSKLEIYAGSSSPLPTQDELFVSLISKPPQTDPEVEVI